jgi:hypothetical protein
MFIGGQTFNFGDTPCILGSYFGTLLLAAGYAMAAFILAAAARI